MPKVSARAERPPTLPSQYRWHWDHPWSERAYDSPGFRLWLGRHGYLSPHFRLSEATSRNGEDLPKRLRPRARRHAFNLEKLRHELGDRPLPVLSWYRSPAYNRVVGGARFSRHIAGDATDFASDLIDRLGRERFFAAADAIFADGGVGTYPSGSAHLDSRGYRARWTSS